jgi:predicted ArsR family transcriptional regulator
MMREYEDIRKKVLDLLTKKNKEMHASEVAEALGITYLQAYRALMMLAADSYVERRRLGRKIIVWRSRME